MSPVARRYAKALFELAVEANALDRFTTEVKSIADTVNGNPELWHVLGDPTVSPAARKAIMSEIAQKLGLSPMVKSGVLLITDHGRAGLLPRIAAILGELADERAGKVRAEITSATALDEPQYTRLAAALEKLTGRKISLVRKVDPTLIGGVVTRIGDNVFDGSVKTRLAEMRQSLLPS